MTNTTLFDSEEYKQARFHYLLQVIFGESLAINYCKTIAEFAPNEDSKTFLLKQQEEEETHLYLLSEYAAKIDRPKSEISKHMRGLHNVIDKALIEKDYASSIFIQNFVVEGLVITMTKELYEHGDEDLKRISAVILHDEVRHVEFGVKEIKRELETNKCNLNKLINIQRKALFQAVLLFADLAIDVKHLGIKWDKMAEDTVKEHLKRIEDAGMHIPLFDKLFLKTAILFFKII